jgi:phosphatidylcholine synthase
LELWNPGTLEPHVILPWVAHLYTALGAVLAFVATVAIVDGDFRSAFFALAIATAVDATDGVLARAVRVKERLPQYDGARLDEIVDYLTYVFVPVLLIVRAGLLPEAWSLPVASAVLLASAYGFGQADAKVVTTDYFFTGFPSYWNIVVLYLYFGRLPAAMNVVVLIACAVLVFVPIRYVYPSRTHVLRPVTVTLGVVWAAMLSVMIWRLPATDGPWLMLSFGFPVYYFTLSLWLHFARAPLAPKTP